ncbi:dynein regulatory complex protein 9 [Halyomorpha halys]|uniref:dynein regulatory complex protein 9 n=1 Tax=Halyomorpha halys TaxID=286706 RepID=UPI000D0C7811|nr:IQ domain-containing protein G-like [Halyomorpha halys]
MAYSNGQLETEHSPNGIFHGKFARFNANVGRIERLIQETVDKLAFAMTIPKLLDNNFELIKTYLKKDELEMLQKVFKKYIPYEDLWLGKKTNHHLFISSSRLSLGSLASYFNNYSTRTENIPQRDEYDFNSALNLLYKNEDIRKISKRHEVAISEAAFNFLQDMKLCMYSLLDKMKLGPQEAETREAYLRKVGTSYNDKTDEAFLLEEKTIEQSKAAENRLRFKLSKIMKIRGDIENLMNDLKEVIGKSSSKMNERMIYDWKVHEIRQENLDKKVNNQVVDLDCLRSKHVKEEKDLRTANIKTEERLKQVLKQYDRAMEEKQNELDMCNATILQEKELLKELNEYASEQEKLHEWLKEDKERTESDIRQAKVVELKCTRAARKIQRYFRKTKRLLGNAVKKGLFRSKSKRKTVHTQSLVRSRLSLISLILKKSASHIT